MFKRIEPQEGFQIRHPKTNKYHKNNHYRQVYLEFHKYDYHLGYSKYDDLNERVMSPNKKLEALTIDDLHDPWISYTWICDMDQFFKWHNLFDSKRVKFAKMMFIGEAQIF